MSQKMTSKQQKFDVWIHYLMVKNNITGYDNKARILGVSRKTLYNWRRNPSDITKVQIAGIKGILGDEEHSVDTLCEVFNAGVTFENRRQK